MQKILQMLFITATLSSLCAQNIWGGVSVATPDNLNAISGNPAGLGIEQGEQSGFYLQFDSLYTYSISFRSDGIGFDLTYNKFSHGIFNPLDGNIGFGSALFPNAYAGLKWNKHHLIDFGLLYRPLNIASIGMVAQFNHDFTEYNSTTLGLALRPLLQHRLTVGADMLLTEADSLFIYPHFTIEPVDGILLSARSNADFDDFQINLAFNFGKETVYSPSTYNDAGKYNAGIGFYTSDQQQQSIFKKTAKDTKHYIRMKLSGLFIEEKPYEPPFTFDFNFNPFGNNPEKGTQLRTWIEKIDELAEDDDIDGLIIDIEPVRAGWAKRMEIQHALQRFQKQDKNIIVYAEKGIGNVDYLLIAMADEIYLNNETQIWLKGLSFEINFYKGLLDTLSIVPEVIRVNYDGKSYKTAMDPFLRRTMSREMKENYGDLLGDLNEVFLDGISQRFSNDKHKTQEIINNGPYLIGENIISSGLADSIMYPDQFNDYVNSMNDKKVTITKWKDIDQSDFYIHEWSPTKKEKIAIIYAVGGIAPGKSNPGPAGSSRMGHKTIGKAIESARKNEDIKAIVMRVDSPGGSVYASDQIWREVMKSTEDDSSNVKPFIVSMSDIAASGGYYIACQADTIIASPATITGSIGVFWFRPNFSKLANRFGVNTEWIKEGEHSDFYTGGRLFNNYEKNKIQDAVDKMYLKFKEKIANGRENINIKDDLDQVAMGRVFTGKRAKDGISIPLVDITGDFNDAIELAKLSAGLRLDDEVEIVEYPQPKNPFSEIFEQSNSRLQNTDLLREILPKELSDQLEVLDILPIIMEDDLQMILPYQITIE